MTDRHGMPVDLHQRVVALAAVCGVLVAALRRGGLMTPDLEGMLATGLSDTAATISPAAANDWVAVLEAVERIAGDLQS